MSNQTRYIHSIFFIIEVNGNQQTVPLSTLFKICSFVFRRKKERKNFFL